MNFTAIDIVLLIPLIYGLAKGAYRGLIGEITSIVGLLGGLIAAFYLSESVFVQLSKFVENPGIGIRVLAFALVFILVVVFVNIIGKAINKGLDLIALGSVNHILGAAFGLSKWIAISSIAVYFFNGIQQDALILQQELIDQSLVYQKLLTLSQHFATYLDQASGAS